MNFDKFIVQTTNVYIQKNIAVLIDKYGNECYLNFKKFESELVFNENCQRLDEQYSEKIIQETFDGYVLDINNVDGYNVYEIILYEKRDGDGDKIIQGYSENVNIYY